MVKLRLTNREYGRLLEALYLASEWEKSLADAYTPQFPGQKEPPQVRESLTAAKRYLELGRKLKLLEGDRLKAGGI